MGRWDLAAATYHPLLVMAEHGEQRSWLRLQRLLSRYDGWPILHYGETETLSLRRLAQRQGASDAQLRRLKRRLVDVHARIRSHWRLPLSSYGLKSVAAWRGFRWSQAGVDGCAGFALVAPMVGGRAEASRLASWFGVDFPVQPRRLPSHLGCGGMAP